jgi:undecaprenyl-diphosphatase
VSVLDAVILAIVQGLTEFLPVSSSGHLVLGQHFLGITDPQVLSFDIFVHFGTLLSVIVYYRSDLSGMATAGWRAIRTMRIKEVYDSSELFRTAIAIVIASIPAGVIGLLFRKQIEDAFADPKLVAVNLVITGLILFLTRLAKPKEGKPIGPVVAFIIGIAQSVAILPGISRSGSTISTGMYLRIPAASAARFSFLMSLPVVAGATLLESRHYISGELTIPFLPTVVGTIVAAFVGYAAITLLVKIVQRGSFSLFAFYCLLLGIFGIMFI